MTVTYRDATAADAEAIAELGRRTFVETFGHLYSPDNLAIFLEGHYATSWEAVLASGAAVRLAEAQGVPIAYARIDRPSLPFDPGDRPAAELRQLYVDSAWHGHGVAVALMDWVLAEARRRGAADLWLSVFTENHRARAFYRRYGFVEVMPYKFMVGTHADKDIICCLALDSGPARLASDAAQSPLATDVSHSPLTRDA